MNELRPDFFSIELLLGKALYRHLSGIPHKLVDTFQNILSHNGAEAQLTEEVNIEISGLQVAMLRLKPEQKSVAPVLQASLQDNYDELLKQNSTLQTEIISKDLESILEFSSSFEEKLLQLVKFSRAHLLVKECGIYGLEDGFTIEGIVQLGHQNKDDLDEWKQEYSALAAIAVSTQAAYDCPTPSIDKQVKQRETGELLKNFYCLPMSNGEVPVGVIYFANKIFPEWREQDLQMAHRFAKAANNLLQKEFYKRRADSLSKTSDSLGKYLSKKVVKNVKQTEKVELGGIEKKVVCLFSDIRSFTTITEGIHAPTLVKLLNFYFEQMSPIIDQYEGTLDKIVGDLIMAVWNIPHDQPDPELLAMNCALDMQKQMKRIVAPEWLRHGVKNVGMGIGVNAGLAVAGNLGSSRFMNYTVVGDTINTAQRLEARAAAGEIWMAECLFPAVDGKIEKYTRKESNIKLKGKDQTVDAYVYHPLSY